MTHDERGDGLSTRQRLEELESRYRTIFETTGTATLIFDEDTTITLVNDEFCRMSGYAREEIEGKIKVSALISPEYLPRIRMYHEQRIKDPSSVPASYELQVTDRQGRLRDGVVTISMIPGTKQRVISFMDVTESRRARQQMYRAEKMAAMGQIVAGVAHEINNPNNFVYFNLPILRQYIEAVEPIVMAQAERDPGLRLEGMTAAEFFADVKSLIGDMQHGSERITGIVGQLRTHSTVQKQERRTEDPRALVERVVTLVGKQVRRRVRRLEVEVPEGLPSICVNAGRIEQVIINLLVNASQASDKEDSLVRVVARASDEGGVEIRVEDNGSGIAQDALPRIFEPFFTTKDPDEGTGLGLWICQGIVEEHGGTLGVSSIVGEGTIFTVSLPVGEPSGVGAV